MNNINSIRLGLKPGEAHGPSRQDYSLVAGLLLAAVLGTTATTRTRCDSGAACAGGVILLVLIGALRAYIATLAACTNAQQVGEAVAQMCADEPKLNGDLIAKEKFIRLLLPFLVRLEKGKGIDNLRLNINEAWTVYKRNRREKGL